MKQELVLLAKNKGFIATFVHDKPFIYSSKEPLRWLFWMTELQKWLREIHDIHIKMQIWQPIDCSNRYGADVISNLVIEEEEATSEFLEYELALEEGLFGALKLLKDE